jgi:hypothetical protein
MYHQAIIVLAVAGTTLALSACTPPSLGPTDEGFGNAVRHNIAVQTVNPEPSPEPGPPTFDGRRAAIAYGRYQADKVKQPSGLKTSTISLIESGGGSEGASGSGN